jgi:murein DD-endopeptidase MepM/ murein hydrolase activator NlpD
MRKKLRTKSNSTSRIHTAKPSNGIIVTPIGGFLLTLLCIVAPTVSLGTLCLSLRQNNLQLSEENHELNAIASEVKAEVDSLGEEIEDLREWADTESDIPLPKSTEATTATSTDTRTFGRGTALQADENNLPPRGGPSVAVSSIEMLEELRKQVPTLNQALNSQVKPAIEEAIAKEAAYPNGIPVVGKIKISSEYGLRRNPFGGGSYEVHRGIDFVGAVGNIITATGDGVVTLAGHNGGYGITVTIDHGNGYESLYAHMSKLEVAVGESINRGQIIGYIGSTGRSSGPHLHYSLYKDGESINPRQLLKLDD